MEHILYGKRCFKDKLNYAKELKMVKIMKSVLICSTILLIGCSNPDSQSNAIDNYTSVMDETNNPSCLVEDVHSGEIVMCFEGDLGYVQSKCVSRKSQNGPIVTFSTTKGCPKDRGYIGRCVEDGGEYIPFKYISKSPYLTPEKEEIMKEIIKKSCINVGGEWEDKTGN